MTIAPTPWVPAAVVTGARGNIGARLTRALASRGGFVMALDATPPAAPSPIVAWRTCDITDYNAVEAALASLGSRAAGAVVFHLAGISSVSACRDQPMRAFDVNVRGCVNVLAACRQAGIVRFVFPSTGLLYRADVPIAMETSPVVARGIYAATKLAAEQMLAGYAADFDFACEIARLSTVIGPEPTPDGVFAAILGQIRRREPLRLRSLTSERDFVFVDDVVEALIRLSETSAGPGARVCNVSSGQRVTIAELARAACAAAGLTDDVKQTEPERRGDVSPALSNMLLLERTGWRPTRSLADAVRQSLEPTQTN